MTKWKGEERRSEPRVAEDSPARVKVLNPLSSTAPSGRAWLLNSSAKGVKLRVPKFISPGATVQVRWLDKFGMGRVRYCLAAETEFHIGVLLLEVQPQATAHGA